MKEAMEFINGIIRPFVTLMLTIGLMFGFVTDKIGGEAFLGVVGLVIGFWFNQRESLKQLEALQQMRR